MISKLVSKLSQKLVKVIADMLPYSGCFSALILTFNSLLSTMFSSNQALKFFQFIYFMVFYISKLLS